MRISMSDLRKLIIREMGLTLVEDDLENDEPSDELWQRVNASKQKERRLSRKEKMASMPDPKPVFGAPDWTLSAAELRTQHPVRAGEEEDETERTSAAREIYRQSVAARRAAAQRKRAKLTTDPERTQELPPSEPEAYVTPSASVSEPTRVDRMRSSRIPNWDEMETMGWEEDKTRIGTEPPQVTPLKNLKRTGSSAGPRRASLGSAIPKGY